ncbi:uncharacterized protein L201_000298 [Kwoniella dendrophila CBS 6074]|uniref:Rab-GAP TBC domain-containing protein n=1 Tax=Kwoniella dendrophila CBS 6074 TaxID=1295534 RepID=A0AAX4JJ47_9TREE
MSYQEDEEENERLFAFQRLLDGSSNASDPNVDLPTLRQSCQIGIPDHPPHLRPLAYSLLLETIPTEKRLWKSTLRSQRERYYNLVKTFMEELESQPSSSSSTHDRLILYISRDLKSLKSSFWRTRTNPSKSSPFNPLEDPNSPKGNVQDEGDYLSDDSIDQGNEDGKNMIEPILSRRALFKRIDLLNEVEHKGGFSKADSSSVSDYNFKTQDVSQSSNSNLESEETPEIMSPKITLSIDSSPFDSTQQPILSRFRLDARKPAPLNISSLQPDSLNISTQLENGQSNSSDKPNSPITLLSPKPLPTGSTSTPISAFSGSLYYPETHLESLTRLIYIIFRLNPQLEYQLSFINIISTFYLIHSGSSSLLIPETNQSKFSRKSKGKGKGKDKYQSTVTKIEDTSLLDYIEENTFWFLSSFLNEVDQIWLNPQTNLNKLNSRLHYMNLPLHDILINQRRLDTKLYAFRWSNDLFLTDLPKSIIPKLFDFILSEPLSTPDKQPKVDLAVDIELSMILLVKDILLETTQPGKHVGLWETDNFQEENRYTNQTKEEDDDDDENAIFVRNLQILRNYPIRLVGGIENIIDMANQLRNARSKAESNGEQIDSYIPPPKVDITPKSQSQMKTSSSWSKALGSLWGGSASKDINSGGTEHNDVIFTDENQNQNQNQNAVPTNNMMERITSRERSDTLDSSLTTSSIQERLSALTTSTPAAKINSPSNGNSSLPRPLILGSSASKINLPSNIIGSNSNSRRSSAASSHSHVASNWVKTNNNIVSSGNRRDSSSSYTTSSSNVSSPNRRNSPPTTSLSYNHERGFSSPPPLTTSASYLRSPPAANTSPINGANGGLYRIGSRQRSRSSLGEHISTTNQNQNQNQIKRDLNYGESPTGDANDQTPEVKSRSRLDSEEDRSITPRPISLTLSDYYRSNSNSNSDVEDQ